MRTSNHSKDPHAPYDQVHNTLSHMDTSNKIGSHHLYYIQSNGSVFGGTTRDIASSSLDGLTTTRTSFDRVIDDLTSALQGNLVRVEFQNTMSPNNTKPGKLSVILCVNHHSQYDQHFQTNIRHTFLFPESIGPETRRSMFQRFEQAIPAQYKRQFQEQTGYALWKTQDTLSARIKHMIKAITPGSKGERAQNTSLEEKFSHTPVDALHGQGTLHAPEMREADRATALRPILHTTQSIPTRETEHSSEAPTLHTPPAVVSTNTTTQRADTIVSEQDTPVSQEAAREITPIPATFQQFLDIQAYLQGDLEATPTLTFAGKRYIAFVRDHIRQGRNIPRTSRKAFLTQTREEFLSMIKRLFSPKQIIAWKEQLQQLWIDLRTWMISMWNAGQEQVGQVMQRMQSMPLHVETRQAAPDLAAKVAQMTSSPMAIVNGQLIRTKGAAMQETSQQAAVTQNKAATTTSTTRAAGTVFLEEQQKKPSLMQRIGKFFSRS